MNSVPHSRRRHSLALIPRSVWSLGFVSLLMDISSEMIHALLPLYMVSVLGTSVLAVGLIEGIAEATAAFMAGLALLVMADLLLAWLPGLPGLVLGVTLWGLHMGFTQGVFSALIADSAPEALRGTAFGVFSGWR